MIEVTPIVSMVSTFRHTSERLRNAAGTTGDMSGLFMVN